MSVVPIPQFETGRDLSGDSSYFEQAADALRQAFSATNPAEQAQLLDEAVRLNRLGVAEERAKLRAWVRESEDEGPRV